MITKMYKFIKQYDQRDCGAACISMVAWHYGMKNPLQFYREIINAGKDGTSIYGLIEGAREIGFVAEALKGFFDELKDSVDKKEIEFPFIAHFKRGHFVVVTALTKGVVEYMDPEKGKLKKTFEEFNDLWSGFIVNVTPGNSFKKQNNIESNVQRIFKIMKPVIPKLMLVFLLSIGLWILGVFTSFTFEAIINEFSLVNESGVEENEDVMLSSHAKEVNGTDALAGIALKIINYFYTKTGTINSFFVFLLVIYIVSSAGSYFRGRVLAYITKLVDESLTYTYFEKILKLPVTYKNSKNDGDYISRFNESYRIRYAISNATVTLMLDSVLGLMGGLILWNINSKLFLISLSVIILYSIIIIIYQHKIKQSNIDVMEKKASMQSYLKEILSGFNHIKANSIEEKIKVKGKRKYNDMLEANYHNDILGIKISALLSFVELLGDAFVLWGGFTQILNGEMMLGSLITFTMLLSIFITPIKNVVMLQQTLQSASVSLDRLYDVLSISDENNCGRKEFINGDVTFKNVSFSYNKEKKVLNDLNLTIKKGSSVAITGESGSGKSTIAKILSRIYTADKGTINIGENDILEYELSNYRKKIYYVDNNPFMFDNSIRYNIDENDGEIRESEKKELQYVCQLCYIDDYINRLPFNYDTIIEEGGASLSQGQKQRIGVARAIIHKPSILILDESLSNLNVNMAIDILNNIRKEMPSMTIILITHMNELIEWCDNEIKLGM